MRGSNKLVLEEADRSIHDALCVVRCLVRNRALIAGGGAPEIELALKLAALADGLEGLDAICLKAYANALEVVPFTLAENAGLNAIQVRNVTSNFDFTPSLSIFGANLTFFCCYQSKSSKITNQFKKSCIFIPVCHLDIFPHSLSLFLLPT